MCSIPLPPVNRSSRHERGLTATSGASRNVKQDSDSETEEDFRTMRRKAKEAATRFPAPSSKPARNGFVLPAPDKRILNVHPSCFDYEGNAQKWISLCPDKDEQQKPKVDPADAVTAELVQFFQAQGLSGPLRAYAHSMVLQGLQDPASLIEADGARLTRTFRLAELESSDELLLRDALRAFQ